MKRYAIGLFFSSASGVLLAGTSGSSVVTQPVMPLRPQTVVVVPGMENRTNMVTIGAGGVNRLDGNQVLVDLFKQDTENNSSIYFHYGHSMPGLDNNNQAVSLDAFYVDAQYRDWDFKGFNIASTSYIPVSTLYTLGGTYPKQVYNVLESDSDFTLSKILSKRSNYSSMAGINYSSAYTNDENMIIPNGLPQDPFLGNWFCSSAFVNGFYTNTYSNVVFPFDSTVNHNIKWESNAYNDASLNTSTNVVRTQMQDVIHFSNSPTTTVTTQMGMEYAKAVTQLTNSYGGNAGVNTKNEVNSKLGIELNQWLSKTVGFTANVNQDSFNQPLKNYIVAFPFDYYITPQNVFMRESRVSMGGSLFYKENGVVASAKAQNKHAQDLIIYNADPLLPGTPYYSVSTPIMLENYNTPISWNEYIAKLSVTLSPGVIGYCNYQYSTISNIPYQAKNMVNGGINYLKGQNNLSLQMNYFEGMYAQVDNTTSLAPIWTMNVQNSYALNSSTTVIVAINNLFNATPIYKPGYVMSGRSVMTSIQYKF